jgi:hypothetical protein
VIPDWSSYALPLFLDLSPIQGVTLFHNPS